MDDDHAQRLDARRAAPALAVAAAATAAIWVGCLSLLPPIAAVTDSITALFFAIRCAAVALTFTLLLGVEAVAHERLFSDAFDPLAGHETRRLRINQRYLQNTLEQAVLFVVGLLGMTLYCAGPSAIRAIVAASVVWTAARIAFWIGYHIAPRHRVAGLIGSAQSMVVLLYVAVRFGYDLAGLPGAAVPLIVFAAAELIIVRHVRRTS